MRTSLTIAVALVLSSGALLADDHWVATWATAQALTRTPPPTNATANTPRGYTNQTIRMIVRTSIPGKRLRVQISNAFGSAPVKLGAAHIALRAKESAIVEGSDHALSFDGKPGATIGPGIVLFSDPLDFNVPKVTDLAVSLYFPGETGPPTT